METKEIKDFINNNNGSSGRMYNEKYIKNNFPEIYEKVILFCSENLNDILFKEKVYHYVHDIKDVIRCKNPNCNNAVNYKNSTLGYHDYCSNECISSDPNIKEIKEKKSYEKFGTKAPCMNDDIKNKMIKTNQEKYGSNSPLQNIDILNKAKETLMKNYGVDNPNKSKEILIRRIESFKKSNYRENFIKTMKEKYGVENPYQVKEFLEKKNKSLLERFGVENPLQNKDIMEKSKKKRTENWMKNIINKNDHVINIDYENKDYTMKCDCNKDHIFKINFNLLKSRRQYALHLCTVCFPENFNQTSMFEKDFFSFIEDNYKKTIRTRCKIIPPYEVDIYLPDIQLAFETNGLYWHSNVFKNKNYHLNKMNLCEKKGIKLINIYEDDWSDKKDIIKSMIFNELDKSENCFIDNFTIKEITDNISIKNFIEKNSLYDFDENFRFIGLFELANIKSLLFFKEISKKVFEIHYCHTNYVKIKNGFKMLMDYFINEYKPEKLINISNRDLYNSCYLDFGFKMNKLIEPSYKYLIKNKRCTIGEDINNKIYDSGKIQLILENFL